MKRGEYEMEYETFVNAISTVGFPIFMCLILCYYMQKNDKDTRAQIAHLTETVNNNTVIMTKLLERFDSK